MMSETVITSAMEHAFDGVNYHRFLDVYITDGVNQIISEFEDIKRMLFSIRLNQNNLCLYDNFQVWILMRIAPKICHYALGCYDINGNVLFCEVIDIFDFKFDELKLYFIDNIMLLPSEYV
ncbi:hypothetical protein BAY06_02410 [Elizabethkingia anophelis]|uniref:DUF6876 family protein n=1 Tax=Elizabethkingia anophelis TaxID=1117645 RepID=UPI00099A8699|nr:DUF6876 family protein [Elizabethkingia anophelis]OPC52965.1 hypothetical protein BAY06_02410 [Elizabethkingia anophelis]